MPEAYGTVSFAHWLKERRRALDLTQEGLAERIGCSYDAVHKIEGGTRRPSRQIAELLADLFNVPAEEREAFIAFARGLRASGNDGPAQQFLPNVASERPPTNNLPAQLTTLIGREKELAEVGALFSKPDVRLLTLTGPPGIGKTRLALHVAPNLTGHYEDGVYLVPLAPISDPNLVVPAIAQALGIRESGRASIMDILVQSLQGKEMLLLLDNFEQVVEAAPTVVSILQVCPSVKVMITSREPLHVRGEHVFTVRPLQLPDLNSVHAIEVLLSSSAVALFIERAQAVKPDFELTEQNGDCVASICVRLEGLPLAIELAAARVRILTPEELLSRLDNRLKLLNGGPRDAPARHQTLRDALDWSYALLSEGEQKLFARLGVFVGGFTLQTVDAVCNARGDLPFDVIDGIDSLLDKSLLKREEVMEKSRYAMLEMIREYALEQLEKRGEAETIRRLHAEYYLAIAEAAEEGLNGQKQLRFLALLEADHDNIRAAIRWATAERSCEAVEIGLKIAGAIWQFWRMMSYFTEGRETLQRLASQAALLGCSKEARAKALNGTGFLAYRQGDYSSARILAEDALALGREVADNETIATSVNILGHLAREHGDYPTARALYEESLALLREIGDKVGIANLLNNLGNVAQAREEYASAGVLYEESLALRREIGDKVGIADILHNLGYLAQRREEYANARALYGESLALRREIGDRWGIAYSLGNLGNLDYGEQEYAKAGSLIRQSLTIFMELGDKRCIAWCLGGLGGVAARSGLPYLAARLLGAAEPLLEAMGIVMDATVRIPFDDGIVAAREQLGEEGFEKAWREGRKMSVEQAIEYELEHTDQEISEEQ